MEESIYCIEKCPLGKEQAQKFLKENESISDAAIDMKMFIETCKKTGCNHKKNQIEKI